MVALSTFENQGIMVSALVGERELSAPVSGKLTKISAGEYESHLRQLTYGLMVKGYRRGDNVAILDSASDAATFLEAGCKLAHLQTVGLSENSQFIQTLSDSDIHVIFVMNQGEAEKLLSQIRSAGLNNIDVYSVLGSGYQTSVSYLQKIGDVWEVKYKPVVDRTIREISMNS